MKKKLNELVWGLSQNKNIMGARYSGAYLSSQHLTEAGGWWSHSQPMLQRNYKETLLQKKHAETLTNIHTHIHTYIHTHTPMLIKHITHIHIHLHMLTHVNSHTLNTLI